MSKKDEYPTGYKTAWGFKSGNGFVFGLAGFDYEACHICKRLLTGIAIRPCYSREQVTGIEVVYLPCRCSEPGGTFDAPNPEE